MDFCLGSALKFALNVLIVERKRILRAFLKIARILFVLVGNLSIGGSRSMEVEICGV
jgi:hypothetical protein